MNTMPIIQKNKSDKRILFKQYMKTLFETKEIKKYLFFDLKQIIKKFQKGEKI